jgi:hypothetical protein
MFLKGVRMKNLIKSSIVIATLALGTSATMADMHARRADRELSKQEVLQRAAKNFDLADADKDGNLTVEERKAFRAERMARQAKKAEDRKLRDERRHAGDAPAE